MWKWWQSLHKAANNNSPSALNIYSATLLILFLMYLSSRDVSLLSGRMWDMWRGLIPDRWLAQLYPTQIHLFCDQVEMAVGWRYKKSQFSAFRVITLSESLTKSALVKTIIPETALSFSVSTATRLLCLYFWGRSSTDSFSLMQAILITEFRWETRTTNGSMLCAWQSESFYSPSQSLAG